MREVAPDAGQSVADPEVEHQVQHTQRTAQPDGLKQKRDEPPDLPAREIRAAEVDLVGKLPAEQQDDQPRRQLAQHQAVDKVGDAAPAAAAFEFIDPIHGEEFLRVYRFTEYIIAILRPKCNKFPVESLCGGA